MEAPFTGLEVAIAGHHPQSLRVHFSMREDVAYRGEGSLEGCGSTLENGIMCPGFTIGDTTEREIAPTVVCLPAPSCGEDCQVPDGGSEFTEQGIGEEVVV